MLNLSKTLLAATFASLLLVGCEKDDETTDESKAPTEFSPSTELALAFKDGIDLNADGATIELSFSTNKSWSVNTDQEWCEATPNKGKSGSGQFSITISPCESLDNREAIITFRTGEIQDYVHIRQQGMRVAYVNVATAGTLEDMLGKNKNQIEELHISGNINADDISLIHELTYGTDIKLQILDLKKANIVNGGSYTSIFDSDRVQRSAKANTLSSYMFCCCILKELILPQTVTTIEDMVVYNMNITKLVLPDNLEKVGNNSVSQLPELKELTIPEHLSSVGMFSFWSFPNVTELQLPSSLRNIGWYSFSNFPKVKRLIIPDGVRKLENCFLYWDNLEYVRLPATLTEIVGFYRMAAFDSESPKEIHLSSVDPPKVDYIMYNPNPNIIIFVPQGGRENYQNDEEWGKFKNIIEE